MNDTLIIVKDLTVQVNTGAPAEDPYGQGFSVIYAEAVVSDGVDIERLLDAKERNVPVTLRCAMLDVIGLITKAGGDPRGQKFVLAIDAVTYRPPTHAWERVERVNRGPA